MSAPKLKNLLIVVLLLVNVFLMILVIPAQLEARRQSREAGQRLEALFAADDIAFHPETVPQGKKLREVRMTVDAQMCAAAAKALLGEDTVQRETERGAYYTSSLGSLQFTGTKFTAMLSLPAQSPEEVSRTVLETMGLHVFDLQSEEENGVVTHTVRLEILGFPVADSPVTLRFENGCLTFMEGVMMTEQMLTRVGRTDAVSARNALVTFLGNRLSTGWMGSAVYAVEQGWYVSRTSGNDSILCPVWCIFTDTGDYLVNGITQSVFLGA